MNSLNLAKLKATIIKIIIENTCKHLVEVVVHHYTKNNGTVGMAIVQPRNMHN